MEISNIYISLNFSKISSKKMRENKPPYNNVSKNIYQSNNFGRI